MKPGRAGIDGDALRRRTDRARRRADRNRPHADTDGQSHDPLTFDERGFPDHGPAVTVAHGDDACRARCAPRRHPELHDERARPLLEDDRRLVAVRHTQVARRRWEPDGGEHAGR